MQKQQLKKMYQEHTLKNASKPSLFHIINTCLGFLAIGLLLGGSWNLDVIKIIADDSYAYVGVMVLAIISGAHGCDIILQYEEDMTFLGKTLRTALLFGLAGILASAMLALLTIYYPNEKSLGDFYYPVVALFFIGMAAAPFLLMIGLFKISKAYVFLNKRKLAVMAAYSDKEL